MKNPKKNVGGEKSFAQKENYEKEGGASKPYSGRENQGKRTPTKYKTGNLPQYGCLIGCGNKVSFGAASNCSVFRKMDKSQRRERCKKYNLCRRCLKSLKRVKHLAQDCPAPLCSNCGKDHHMLICPNERTEQKLHKAQGDDEDDEESEDEDYYQGGDLFDEDQ